MPKLGNVVGFRRSRAGGAHGRGDEVMKYAQSLGFTRVPLLSCGLGIEGEFYSLLFLFDGWILTVLQFAAGLSVSLSQRFISRPPLRSHLAL